MTDELAKAHNIKILVIDDDIKMLELLEKVLLRKGYTVETASKPKE
ncbi:hypothetical protein JGI9_01758, partial [Candidatus Kryptonium thompsonii]